MHIDWQRLLIQVANHLWENRLPVTLALGAAISAAVKTMPTLIPQTKQDCWTWLSDWAHQMFNTSRGQQQPGK